ncbi:DUF1206 domain-containing protein [Oricola cellulosilytica]|uniref:DUF1206 domain-containing protein n=1 Tax=Oricola cellulosilytica TaxID=1429082 RepID=A0A4R0PFW2_9HYPH|nr:DUF1206 domain-containing protein [Oricola cellulosilytica]TCD15305.1 DUF1206 domain-containing protein [Oricola cellulosilytica]
MDTAKPWIKPLARMGYAARGLVYFIIGLFAILAAAGAAQEKDSRGALQTLLEQPFGTVLVAVLILGLVGYVVWRLIQGIMDTDDHGTGAKGMAVRGGLLVSAFTYATLALLALDMLGVIPGSGGGSGSSGGSGSLSDFVAGFVGESIVSLGLAIIFLGVAGAHFWKAFKQKYAEHFEANEDAMKVIHPVSITGLAARGFVFAIIAVLFFYRFLNAGDSGDTPGLKDALEFVQGMPAGQYLLAATGIGLLAFSAYSFAESRWRRINVEDA